MHTQSMIPAAALLVFSGCGGSQDPGSTPLQGTLTVEATDLGVVSAQPDILGRDGAYGGEFQGYSVWLYGDTILAQPDASGRTFISNSWSYTSDLDASDGITGFQERLDPTGSPTMILPETPDEQAFNATHFYANPCQQAPCGARWAIWPMAIITDPVSTHALVFYGVVSVAGPGFDFQGVGTSVAIWRSFSDVPQRPTFSPPIVPDHPDLMFTQHEPTFGSAALIDGSSLYVYGCGNSLNGLDKGCRLGKVNPATVQDRNTWSFYAGDGHWSASVSDAVPVFDGNDILSVAWNQYLQRYIALYSELFSQTVVLRTSRAPEGPWSEPLPAFSAMQPASGNTYDAHAHIEYDSGQVTYVTYSRNLTSGDSEVRLVALHLQATGPLP